MSKAYKITMAVLNCICAIAVAFCVISGRFQTAEGAINLLIASGAYLATGYASQLEIVEVEE